jgi:hypothetical protein
MSERLEAIKAGMLCWQEESCPKSPEGKHIITSTHLRLISGTPYYVCQHCDEPLEIDKNGRYDDIYVYGCSIRYW